MNKLAHFTSTESLIKYILPNRKLRASNLIKLNDPTENKWTYDSIFIYESQDESTPLEDYESFYKKHSSKIGEHFKIFCFSSYEHHIRAHGKFSDPHLNLRMWSQYGRDHSGACIIFKKDELIYKARKELVNHIIKDHDILYEQTYETYPSYTIHDHSEFDPAATSICDFFHNNIIEQARQSPKALFTKTIDWRDELEYRIAVYDHTNEYCHFDITDLIDEIYFGLKADDEYIRIVKAMHPDIQLRKLLFTNQKIEIGEV